MTWILDRLFGCKPVPPSEDPAYREVMKKWMAEKGYSADDIEYAVIDDPALQRDNNCPPVMGRTLSEPSRGFYLELGAEKVEFEAELPEAMYRYLGRITGAALSSGMSLIDYASMMKKAYENA